MPPIAVCQSAYSYLVHRNRGQAPSHIVIFIDIHNCAVRQCEPLLFSARGCIVSALCRPCACCRYVRLLCPNRFPVDRFSVALPAWQ